MQMQTVVLQTSVFPLFLYKNEKPIPQKMVSWEDDDEDEDFENVDDFDDDFDIEEIDESELGDDFKNEFREIYDDEDFIDDSEDEEYEDEEESNDDDF